MVNSCARLPDMENLISLPAFAKRCGISRAWAVKLAEGKAIKAVRLGHYYYVPEKEAEAWACKFKKQGRFNTFPRMTKQGLVMKKGLRG